ncbi:hypothetical protein F5883DRAFT_642774 [Diaporthe sp. PMI_573]|nr:hypothetical protein F5883DRAFT_642774 [Diaporthaceae sp. PMI_573]
MAEDFPSTITDEARARASISSETVIGVSALFIALSTLFTGTRLYTRFTVYQQFWWDDWSMVVAWIGTIVLCTLFMLMMQHGGGMHHQDTPLAEYKRYVEIFQDLQMVARTSMFFAKLSILLLYVRLFFPKGVSRSALWWIIQVVVWLNFLYTLGLILAIALQCVPQNRPYGSSCVDQYMVLISASIINIISDILVLVIPMASLWRLNMSRRRKLAVWALFAFGTLAPLSSIARLAYQIPMANGKDTTVIYMIVVVLALAEQVIGIVAGCAPIVSTWFVRLVLQKGSRDAKISPGAAANAPRTITQRFWPNREGGEPETPRERRLRKWKRSTATDPYPLTMTVQTTASEEALDPGFAELGNVESGRRSQGIELGEVTPAKLKEGFDAQTP